MKSSPTRHGMDRKAGTPVSNTRPPDNDSGETQGGGQKSSDGICSHAAAIHQKTAVQLAQPGEPMVERALVRNGFATGFQPIVNVVSKNNRAAASANHHHIEAQQHSRPEVKLEHQLPKPSALGPPQPLPPQTCRTILNGIGFAQHPASPFATFATARNPSVELSSSHCLRGEGGFSAERQPQQPEQRRRHQFSAYQIKGPRAEVIQKRCPNGLLAQVHVIGFEDGIE